MPSPPPVSPAPQIPHGARHAPATLRNRDAILSLLKAVYDPNARILEIAAGSGEHGHYFTRSVPGWRWEPTDIDPSAVSSIAAWGKHEGSALAPPRQLDVCDPAWHAPAEEAERYDGVFCANMIHIAPPQATQGLMSTAAAQLRPGGQFVLYGPFTADSGHTAPSNAAFDASLKSRNNAWGIRSLGAVVELARTHALVHQKTHAMPANNLCLQFMKGDAAPFKVPPS